MGGSGAGPITGTVGPNGGSISNLVFAIVGDTRPVNENDTAGYPTQIIQTIWQDVQSENPRPPFALATGDYMYSDPTAKYPTAGAQLDLYLSARNGFQNTVFFTMGNHECTGYTDSNCGQGNADGITPNYTAFMSKLLGTVNKTQPYYGVNITASDGSWTAKFLVVAANAWTSAQASWLKSAMAAQTTYTFVVRHEPGDVTDAIGVSPSEAIMAQYPYTLALVGHTHTFYHAQGSREVTIGNGGAPLGGSVDYGYAIVSRRSTGALEVHARDYLTRQDIYAFAVNPDGSPTN